MRKSLEQFAGLIDDVILADDVHCYKLDLHSFKAAQQKYGFDNSNHIYIANGYWWDIVPCTKLGWRKIWVHREGYLGNPREQPYQEIQNLAQISKIL